MAESITLLSGRAIGECFGVETGGFLHLTESLFGGAPYFCHRRAQYRLEFNARHVREVDYKSMPAADKVAILLAMGFSPQHYAHTPDCPAAMDGGNRCNCVPDATVWVQPADVDKFRHETWHERLAKSRARSSE